MDANDPRMRLVDCEIARIRYEAGDTGIEIAEGWATAALYALLAVHDGRAKDPKSFPGFGDGSPEETARRIVARLLDAGWRPPDADCLALPELPEETQ